MPREKFALDPQVLAGDTVVKVGPLSWGGVKAIRDRIKTSNLELPRIEFGSGDKSLSLLTLDDFADFAQRNLAVLARWLASSPELIDVLIVDGTNVAADATNALSASEAMTVAKAVVDASVADGLYGNAALFFAGLLGPLFAAPPASEEGLPVAPLDATLKPDPAGPSATSIE